MMFCVVATVGIIAGVSWIFAGAMSEPTFVAQTTIKPQSPDGAPIKKRDLGVWLRKWIPVDKCFDIPLGHIYAVLVAQQVLQQDLEAIR